MINRNLEIFIHVADSGSITETAHALYISQPAVSMAIKNLEQELEVQLFHRSKRRGLVLTSAGERILYYAHQMQEMENHIYQTAYLEKNLLGGKLKVASFPIVTSTILSKAIFRYRSLHPDVEVELIDCDPETVQSLVENHAVDLGISASPFGNVDHETLIVDRMVGIFRPEDPHPPKIDLFGDTKDLVFCTAGKKTVLDTLRGANRINFSNSLIVHNHETIVNMVQEGNGIGVISEFTLNAIPNDLIRCPVEPDVPVEIALVAPSLKDLTPVAAEFVRLIKAVMAGKSA